MGKLCFGKVDDYKNELERITKSVKKLRNLKSGKITQWDEAAEWHMKYSNLHGIPALSLTITLSPTGCEWARQGGCTMCGEFEGAYKRDDLLNNPQFHISQFVSAVTNPSVWDTALKEEVPISWIRINQEGNFTNPHEMNIEAQEKILRLATRIKGVKRVTIESRPQYLSEKTVLFLADIFNSSGVELEIGMGLEAENDVVRNICINKRGTREQFEKTVNLLKKHNIYSLAYILLKPPFLTEKEAIDEAVETAHFAANIGFSRISFEPMSIHQYTLADLLKENGDYKPPWLWSVIEVAKRCSDISNIFGIGGVGYYPVPTEYAHNYCMEKDDCNRKIIEAIKKYNEIRDVSVFEHLDCRCKRIWYNECLESPSSLDKRIDKQLTMVEKNFDKYQPIYLSEDIKVRGQRIIVGNSQK